MQSPLEEFEGVAGVRGQRRALMRAVSRPMLQGRDARLIAAVFALTAALTIGRGVSAQDSAPVQVVKAVGTADATGSDTPFGAFENSKNRGPVNIQSDSMVLDYKNNAVLFSGKVHAVQADGELTSRTLDVKYGKDFHVVQEMVADGDVRLSQGLRWCASDHMVMNQVRHTAVLTGSPVCHDANDEISGSKITVHTDSGRSEVEGRVKALIFPHEAKTRDNEASSSTKD